MRAVKRVAARYTIDRSDAQWTPAEEAEVTDAITDLIAAARDMKTQGSIIDFGVGRKPCLWNKARLGQASRLMRSAHDRFDAAIAQFPFGS